jgi:hypothetical protein
VCGFCLFIYDFVPNLTVQATAAAHCSFHVLGGSLDLAFVLAQSPAAVPDLCVGLRDDDRKPYNPIPESG